MKLWHKLALVTVMTFAVTSVVLGLTVIYRSALYNKEKTLENYEQQLRTTAYALAGELQNSPVESYREATKNSYLNFLIRRYDASKYILTEDGQVVCNETPFELTESLDESFNGNEAFSMIQKNDKKAVLIAGKKVPVSGNREYELILVKDISPLYRDISEQTYFCLLLCLIMAVIAVLIVFLVTGRILKPLKELQKAAEDLSGGRLGRRAAVHSGDEVGMLAKAFNSMAEKIEDQVTELQAEAERQKLMLGSLAHELKTPMTSIIGYSDSLLHVRLKEEQKERALVHIYEESKRLERLSGKLMSLIGMYDNDRISMKKTDMKKLFEQVAELEAYHLLQKEIRLIWFCEMEDRRLDEDLFTSLLINLIDNAIKASEKGAAITLTGRENVIFVRDQGCGIPKEELARVTEAFYMVDKARSRKEGGSGLGLALCSRIAELHSAKLRIESELTKGTTVFITFDEEK